MVGRAQLLDVDGQLVRDAVSVHSREYDGGTLYTVTVEGSSGRPLDRIVLDLDWSVHTLLEHGWQSWSTVRVATPDAVRPARRDAPRWFRGQMLAERDGAGHELSGDSFLVSDKGTAGFLSMRHNVGRVVVDADGDVRAEWALDAVEIPSGSSLTLDPLWVAAGNPDETYVQYAALARGPRVAKEAPLVWCSWYQYFDRVTPADVRENLAGANRLGINVVQIDDGYQRAIGEWTHVNDRWAVPMDVLASEIVGQGFVPGIWTAPFCAIEGGELATAHPEWLVQNAEGHPTTSLFHEGWGGRVFALDTSQPEVLAHVMQTFAALRRQGFGYFKIDFCHAAAAVGVRQRNLTRAQALRHGLEAVRRGIGDDAYLVGCGSPLLSAVGVVDAMRVSEDVAPFWEPRAYFEGFEECSVSAKSAISATVRRAPLHGRWFTSDPDCVMVRDSETELDLAGRRAFAAAAWSSGGLIALSDRLSLYGTAQVAAVARLVAASDPAPRTIRGILSDEVTISWPTGTATFVLEGDEPSVHTSPPFGWV